MEIKNQKDNKLFARQELELSTSSDTTPKKADVLKQIAELTKKPEELIVLNGIKGNFGSKIYKILADVYNSQEEKDKFQIKRKEKKK